ESDLAEAPCWVAAGARGSPAGHGESWRYMVGEAQLPGSEVGGVVAEYSKFMEVPARKFAESLDDVCMRAHHIPWLSTSTGEYVAMDEPPSHLHWAAQITTPVLLEQGLCQLHKDGANIFVEIGVGNFMCTSGITCIAALPASTTEIKPVKAMWIPSVSQFGPSPMDAFHQVLAALQRKDVLQDNPIYEQLHGVPINPIFEHPGSRVVAASELLCLAETVTDEGRDPACSDLIDVANQLDSQEEVLAPPKVVGQVEDGRGRDPRRASWPLHAVPAEAAHAAAAAQTAAMPPEMGSEVTWEQQDECRRQASLDSRNVAASLRMEIEASKTPRQEPVEHEESDSSSSASSSSSSMSSYFSTFTAVSNRTLKTGSASHNSESSDSTGRQEAEASSAKSPPIPAPPQGNQRLHPAFGAESEDDVVNFTPKEAALAAAAMRRLASRRQSIAQHLSTVVDEAGPDGEREMTWAAERRGASSLSKAPSTDRNMDMDDAQASVLNPVTNPTLLTPRDLDGVIVSSPGKPPVLVPKLQLGATGSLLEFRPQDVTKQEAAESAMQSEVALAAPWQQQWADDESDNFSDQSESSNGMSSDSSGNDSMATASETSEMVRMNAGIDLDMERERARYMRKLKAHQAAVARGKTKRMEQTEITPASPPKSRASLSMPAIPVMDFSGLQEASQEQLASAVATARSMMDWHVMALSTALSSLQVESKDSKGHHGSRRSSRHSSRHSSRTVSPRSRATSVTNTPYITPRRGDEALSVTLEESPETSAASQQEVHGAEEGSLASPSRANNLGTSQPWIARGTSFTLAEYHPESAEETTMDAILSPRVTPRGRTPAERAVRPPKTAEGTTAEALLSPRATPRAWIPQERGRAAPAPGPAQPSDKGTRRLWDLPGDASPLLGPQVSKRSGSMPTEMAPRKAPRGDPPSNAQPDEMVSMKVPRGRPPQGSSAAATSQDAERLAGGAENTEQDLAASAETAGGIEGQLARNISESLDMITSSGPATPSRDVTRTPPKASSGPCFPSSNPASGSKLDPASGSEMDPASGSKMAFPKLDLDSLEKHLLSNSSVITPRGPQTERGMQKRRSFNGLDFDTGLPSSARGHRPSKLWRQETVANVTMSEDVPKIPEDKVAATTEFMGKFSGSKDPTVRRAMMLLQKQINQDEEVIDQVSTLDDKLKIDEELRDSELVEQEEQPSLVERIPRVHHVLSAMLMTANMPMADSEAAFDLLQRLKTLTRRLNDPSVPLDLLDRSLVRDELQETLVKGLAAAMVFPDFMAAQLLHAATIGGGMHKVDQCGVVAAVVFSVMNDGGAGGHILRHEKPPGRSDGDGLALIFGWATADLESLKPIGELYRSWGFETMIVTLRPAKCITMWMMEQISRWAARPHVLHVPQVGGTYPMCFRLRGTYLLLG
ncbi:hypothetical protein CYMTET_10775, partial [Cymbomonas tetramitiformis]